ncbi:hypothetical protein PIB30_063231 [Stylosanthes scabra]|uniref:Uncharacterized protein n=1 Tax=Stylosanthes scabra TaxID=79078 RepID=A0ABU6TL27_9FABA|nr:hypothetical protein [Stylosanthes scabra]
MYGNENLLRAPTSPAIVPGSQGTRPPSILTPACGCHQLGQIHRGPRYRLLPSVLPEHAVNVMHVHHVEAHDRHRRPPCVYLQVGADPIRNDGLQLVHIVRGPPKMQTEIHCIYDQKISNLGYGLIKKLLNTTCAMSDRSNSSRHLSSLPSCLSLSGCWKPMSLQTQHEEK